MQILQVQVMFVQYQELPYSEKALGHSVTVPKTHLYAHGATRGPPDCKSSTTQSELLGCICCSIELSDMLQYHNTGALEAQKAAVLSPNHIHTTCLRKKN